MAKVKQPLLSFDARRKLGDDIVFKRQGRTAIVETRPIPKDARSVGQLSWRHMFLKVVALWHALSAAEKEAWESLGRERHMTGYAWFVSQALRPNPGIYLPLQGGTMSGDIDMVKNRILRLPLPVDGQEPVSLTYFNNNLPVGGYTEGARVYHSAAQSIPNGVQTVLTFNSEVYDTDNMHGVDVPLTRLKCQTAGVYVIIGQGVWGAHATGWRDLSIRRNGVTAETEIRMYAAGAASVYQQVVIILTLALNDYVEFLVQQTRGGALNFGGALPRHCQFEAQRIG